MRPIVLREVFAEPYKCSTRPSAWRRCLRPSASAGMITSLPIAACYHPYEVFLMLCGPLRRRNLAWREFTKRNTIGGSAQQGLGGTRDSSGSPQHHCRVRAAKRERGRRLKHHEYEFHYRGRINDFAPGAFGSQEGNQGTDPCRPRVLGLEHFLGPPADALPLRTCA